MLSRGMDPAALRFLRDLCDNNTKAWFDAHRDEYENLILEPARDLVIALGEALHEVGVDVHADPRVNGSIFRINRDTRFSKDKRPYKDHLDLWFWQGDGPSRQCPGYWFRLTAEQLILGAGMHHFQPEVLARFREAVADPARGEALEGSVARVREAGYRIGGERYKRVPAGYAAPPSREALLRHDGLFCWLELAVPPETHTPGFASFCAERYAPMKPVQDWLVGFNETG
jgi:uncharacterized protein (TIGR02453 family)